VVMVYEWSGVDTQGGGSVGGVCGDRDEREKQLARKAPICVKYAPPRNNFVDKTFLKDS